PEVGKDWSAIAVQQDVGGLDVAVEHAVPVRVIQRVGDRLQHRDRVVDVDSSAEPVGQRASADELEHQVRDAALVAEVVDAEDVRVAEPRDGHRLLMEALAVLLVLGEELGQDLDRHVAVERGVVGLVDGGHAAAPDALDDAVGPELDPWAQAHRSPRNSGRVSSRPAPAPIRRTLSDWRICPSQSAWGSGPASDPVVRKESARTDGMAASAIASTTSAARMPTLPAARATASSRSEERRV